MENLKEELTKSRNFTVFTLICALVVVYGGTSLSYGEGTWFYVKIEFDASDESDTEMEVEAFHTLKEIISEGDVTVNGTKTDLDDDTNYKKDREDVIEFTKNLALLSIVLVITFLALIMGLLTGQFEKEKSKEYLGYAEKVCLGLIVICMLNAAKFAMDFPEAWEDDIDGQLSEECGVDDDIPAVAMFVGGCENKNTQQYIPGVLGTFEATWHPGPAWFITFVIIPGLAALEYFRLKEISQRGLLIEYESASSRKSKHKISIPEIIPQTPVQAALTVERPKMQRKAERPKMQKKAEKSDKKKFKPKQAMVDIECPSCDAVMSVPKLNKMQEVKCKECGLSGEIEI